MDSSREAEGGEPQSFGRSQSHGWRGRPYSPRQRNQQVFSIDPRELRADFKFLVGTEEPSLDEKGRVVLTTKKRERLGSPFVLTVAFEGCLVAYPSFLFEEIANKILQTPRLTRAHGYLSRQFIGEADDEVRFDAQGRFVIPHRLRERAGIKDRVVIKGVGDHLEIWSKDKFTEYETNPEFAQAEWDRFNQAWQEITAQ